MSNKCNPNFCDHKRTGYHDELCEAGTLEGFRFFGFIIPRGFKVYTSPIDAKEEARIHFTFLPTPGGIGGMYVTAGQFANLMRANKHNPKAIQYLADMIGD